MAGVAEQPAQLQAGQRRDRLDEAERVAVRIDPAAMKADVHFDQHVERAPGAPHRVRPAARDLQVIDDDRDRRAIHQRAAAAARSPG